MTAQIATTTYSSNQIVSLLDALRLKSLALRCGLRHACGNPATAAERHQRSGCAAAAVNNRVRFDAAQSLTWPSNFRRAATRCRRATVVANRHDFVAVFVGALV
jgi:hypothetical protein